jgi:hypothetical protein
MRWRENEKPVQKNLEKPGRLYMKERHHTSPHLHKSKGSGRLLPHHHGWGIGFAGLRRNYGKEMQAGLSPAASQAGRGKPLGKTLPPESPGGISQFTDASTARIPGTTTPKFAAELTPSPVLHLLET